MPGDVCVVHVLQRQLGQHLAGQPDAAWVDMLEVREGDMLMLQF
jgi:hypothetical protein